MSDRLCVPCANGRCYRCIGETANGPDTCACACKGQQRGSTLVDAPTPNAVEEAVDAICGLTVVPEGIIPASMSYVTPAQFRERVARTIAAVRREVSDRMARENVVLQEAAYQRGRRDTLREVRELADKFSAGEEDKFWAAFDQMEAK